MSSARRAKLPEQTQNYRVYASKQEESNKKQCLLSKDGKRSDGRDWNTMRDVSISCGVVNGVTGSAYIEMGTTKVVCAVRGPRELNHGEEFKMEGIVNCEVTFAPFSKTSNMSQKKEQQEKFLSNLVVQAVKPATICKQFPKLQVDISLMILEDGGSLVAAAVLCAAIAMVTGGIEMRDIPTACKVSYGGDTLLCDPVTNEEYSPLNSAPITSHAPLSHITGDMVIVFSDCLKEISCVYQRGIWEGGERERAMDLCVTGCKELRERVKRFLEQLDR